MLTALSGGRQLLVFGTKPGDIEALDPDKRGRPVWSMNVVGGAPISDAVRPSGNTGGHRGPLWGGAADDDYACFGLNAGGVAAHGGSISAPGPTVAGGMLFVGSGYGVVRDTPGNVPLAFSIEQP
jgi:hypothetical protein